MANYSIVACPQSIEHLELSESLDGGALFALKPTTFAFPTQQGMLEFFRLLGISTSRWDVWWGNIDLAQLVIRMENIA